MYHTKNCKGKKTIGCPHWTTPMYFATLNYVRIENRQEHGMNFSMINPIWFTGIDLGSMVNGGGGLGGKMAFRANFPSFG